MSVESTEDLKPYRRGLVLGLTMAEVMILVIFALLLALTSSLATRDAAIADRDERIAETERRLKRLQAAVQDQGAATRLMEVVVDRYPNAGTFDEYFKELTEAFAAEDLLADVEDNGGLETALAEADLGRRAQEAASRAGFVDAAAFLDAAAGDAPLAAALRAAAAAAGAADPATYLTSITNAGTDGANRGWPPFISLSEEDGYFFESGSALLQADFQTSLKTKTIHELRRLVDEYKVDVIEVIGHTDEVPMNGVTNLDASLIPASRGMKSIAGLGFADNAGLGMARAVSVVTVLRADPRLQGITILPLSGAQMIVPVDRPADGTQPGDRSERRRIEFRLRKSTNEASAEP